jgi:hypothetical protein
MQIIDSVQFELHTNNFGSKKIGEKLHLGVCEKIG